MLGFYCCHYLVSGFFCRDVYIKPRILRYYFSLLQFTFLTYFCVVSFACGGLEMAVTILDLTACLLKLRPDFPFNNGKRSTLTIYLCGKIVAFNLIRN